jgi:murein DD-endopeptidase MepM/ murein hydrolase activator NlpD
MATVEKQEPRHPHEQRYRVLIVTGDGRLVTGAAIPRHAALLAALVIAALVVLVGVLAGDWWALRVAAPEARATAAELSAARRTIETIEHRIAALQRDTVAWRALHDRIWQAIGPDSEPRNDHLAIGGAAHSIDTAAESSAASDLDRLANSVREESQNLHALDQVMARAGKLLAALPMRWPVRGEINSEFGQRVSPWTGSREFHAGMDIGAATGTPVLAPAPGTVEYAGEHPAYGLTIVLDHGHDVRTVYAHLSQVSGGRGQRVDRGALIGRTGNTGRSSGPHLHYEVLVNGRPVNPRAYLWD